MTISMYQASVPVFQKMLRNFDGILDKAAASAAARKFDPQVLLNARLAPDMFHFTRQVQIATAHATGGAARLAGLEPPKFEDNEASFADLKGRLAQAQAFLATLQPAQIDGSEERQIVLKYGPNVLEFTGLPYLTMFALPNFFFHYTTAYAILRHNGVDLGKRDFAG
ncbi:MAG: DUF1993 domain-containing protein [Gammaproteobacteria bacterium]|jgi:hypothetical protein|nr:MAG: DUF1993 domain-containing protein [Gammaproteobacteria bacterium]